MMLADRIKQHAPEAFFPGFAAAVTVAEKFHISQPVSVAAASVAEQGVETLKKAMPLFRMPYELTWWEFLHNERPTNWERKAATAQRIGTATIIMPQRIGFLIDCRKRGPGLQRGTAYMAWDGGSQYEDDVEVNPIGVNFDWSEVNTLGDQTLDPIHRVHMVQSVYAKPFLDAICMLGKDVKGLLQTFSEDWHGEINYIFSVIGLVNSRRAVKFTDVDLAKVNKHRLARNKPTLLNHRTVELDLSRVQMRRMGLVPGVKNILPLQKVRGHFKVRRTGIFWWMPHVRGDAAHGISEHDYRVTT